MLAPLSRFRFKTSFTDFADGSGGLSLAVASCRVSASIIHCEHLQDHLYMNLFNCFCCHENCVKQKRDSFPAMPAGCLWQVGNASSNFNRPSQKHLGIAFGQLTATVAVINMQTINKSRSQDTSGVEVIGMNFYLKASGKKVQFKLVLQSLWKGSDWILTLLSTAQLSSGPKYLMIVKSEMTYWTSR